MASDPVLVLLLRRDENTLSREEHSAFEQAFPGKEITFHRTDPIDFVEHALICDELRPVAVLLPRERPIPSRAMEHGFQHVTVTPAGLQELLPLVPQFKPFVPKS